MGPQAPRDDEPPTMAPIPIAVNIAPSVLASPANTSRAKIGSRTCCSNPSMPTTVISAIVAARTGVRRT